MAERRGDNVGPMEIPDDLSYSADHEWVRVDATTATIGITDFAQDALGDVVYVSPAAVGDNVVRGDSVAEIESTKSVSEIYAPVTGTTVARNEQLDAQPELVNQDPYGDGWILRIDLGAAGAAALEGLLDAAAYRALVADA